MTYYVIHDQGKRKLMQPAKILSREQVKVLDHTIRQQIVSLLCEQELMPNVIAKKLKLHEQTLYYHIKLLHEAGIIEVVEETQIRGTVAKSYKAVGGMFIVAIKEQFVPFTSQTSQHKKLDIFLAPFARQGILDAPLVVGSPDPHGPFKARARDGHYAIDLAMFLGQHMGIPDTFNTQLDVDASFKLEQSMILVGGPVTNMLVGKINKFLPAKFSQQPPWGIIAKKDQYTDDTIGFIARIPHPKFPQKMILVFAGIRYIGTKAAVIAFTRNTQQVLDRFTEQKKFYAIVQGFDLDGDGRLDSVEILE